MPRVGQKVAAPRITLVGEQNPYGGDPYYALYPAPDGCSGHRLCCLILGMRRADYLWVFERVNLCGGPWRTSEGRERALELGDSDRRLVLCGKKVCDCFCVPYEPFSVVAERYCVLPHPSGRCRTWCEIGAFARARAAVAGMVPALSGLLGLADRNGNEKASEGESGAEEIRLW